MSKWLEAAMPVRKAMDKAGAYLTDEQAVEAAAMYRAWEVGVKYATGDRRLYADNLYTCLQAHTSQETWKPADAPSLWAKVLIPDPDVIPEWEQPDSTNAYKLGDKVTHNGKTWECTAVDGAGNNTWEPGVYGWTGIEG